MRGIEFLAGATGPTATSVSRSETIEDKVEEQLIEQRIGKNFRQKMGTLLFSDRYHGANELIANSWDGRASNVDISYEKGRSFVISDDGEGMDPKKGLPDFYRYADSIREEMPSREGERPFFGTAGVAKSAVPHLAFAYTLRTTKEGSDTEYVIREVFVRDVIDFVLKDNQEIKAIEDQKKRIHRIREIREAVLNGVSPSNIPELKYNELIHYLEEEYGPIEKVVNKGGLDDIRFTKEKVPKSKHGTTISLHPLKFEREGMEIDLDELEKRIVAEFSEVFSNDSTDPFRIHLNNTLLQKPSQDDFIEYGEEVELPLCGKVVAEILYSPNIPLKWLKGVYPYVNRRKIGRGDFVDLYSFRHSYSLATRLRAKLYVDGLRECLRLDKENISFDHPKFKELQNYAHKLIGRIVKDVSRMEEVRKSKKVAGVIEKVSVSLTNSFRMSKLSDLIPHEKGGDEVKATPRKAQVRVQITGEDKAGPNAYFDVNTTTVYINRDLRVMDSSSLNSLKQFLSDKAEHAINYASMVKIHPQFKRISELFDQGAIRVNKSIVRKGKTVGELIEGLEKFRPDKKPTAIPLLDIRYYRQHELSLILGRPRAVISRLIEYKVLPKADKWRGDRIRKVANTLFGYKTIEEIARDYVEKKNAVSYLNAERRLMRNVREFGPKDYLKNIGSKGNPLWLIPRDKEGEFFVDYYASGKKLRRKSEEEVYGVITVCKTVKQETGLSISRHQLEEIVQDPDEAWAVMKVGKANRKGLPADALNTLVKNLKKPSFREKYRIS